MDHPSLNYPGGSHAVNNTDQVEFVLAPGEVWVPASVVRRYGEELLRRIAGDENAIIHAVEEED